MPCYTAPKGLPRGTGHPDSGKVAVLRRPDDHLRLVDCGEMGEGVVDCILVVIQPGSTPSVLTCSRVCSCTVSDEVALIKLFNTVITVIAIQVIQYSKVS